MIDLTPEEEKCILEDVYPFEGELVYSVDTTLVARIQEANLRVAQVVDEDSITKHDNEMEI